MATSSHTNQLPCGLLADWNDCLKLGYHGESLFVAFQLRIGLTTYADISTRLGKEDEAKWALAERDKLDANIQKKCWDGKWFVWAIAEDGGKWSRDLFTVKIPVRQVQDVVLVPKQAVSAVKGSFYVNVVQEDGTVTKTGFISGGSNNNSPWAICGLDEEMEICWE